MFNPFDLRALGKAVRGHSLTFASVFGLAVLGYSSYGLLRAAFSWLPLPWWALLVLPFVAVVVLAKHEHRLVADVDLRRRLAVALCVAAMLAATVGRMVLPAPAASAPSEEIEQRPVRRPGPPGRF